MDLEEWAATYGPPYLDPPYAIGATLIYEDEDGLPENGEILYVTTGPHGGPAYVVSPAGDIFPCSVWPEQIICSM